VFDLRELPWVVSRWFFFSHGIKQPDQATPVLIPQELADQLAIKNPADGGVMVKGSR